MRRARCLHTLGASIMSLPCTLGVARRTEVLPKGGGKPPFCYLRCSVFT